jgi:outer membrane lipoprotein-sorting protein
VGERIVRQLRQELLAIFPCLAVLFCLVGALAGPAYGYILPGPQILDLMSDKVSGIKTLRVDQRVTVVDPTVSDEPVIFQETLNYIFPDQFRSDSVHQDNRRIHVVSRGQALTVVDDTIRDNGSGYYDQYKDLLLNNSAYMLQKTLYNHHIDVGITSLGRLGDQVVFVIGARYPDESVSQVWVDQERFVPLRWLNVRQNKGADQEERWDFLYSHWQKVDDAHYPFKIETYHNKQLIRRIEVTKVDADAAIDAGLFDIAHLRSVYKQQVAKPNDEKPSPSDMDEVQRTIEDFKKKFEP